MYLGQAKLNLKLSYTHPRWSPLIKLRNKTPKNLPSSHRLQPWPIYITDDFDLVLLGFLKRKTSEICESSWSFLGHLVPVLSQQTSLCHRHLASIKTHSTKLFRKKPIRT